MIFVQDLKSRAVYWILFPILVVTFIALYFFTHQTLSGFWQLPLTNISFVAVQLLLVSLWFSFKQKRWVNITSQLLGWGDVLFLICLTCCFSIMNFAFFYVMSLILVILVWSAAKILFTNIKHIPLAGLQSIILLTILNVSWLRPGVDLTSDYWISQLIR